MERDDESPVFEIRKLVKVFKQGRRGVGRPAVDGFSLTVHRGEALGIVGESGSGKTTVGRILVGLEKATSGQVYFEGSEVTALPYSGRAQLRRKVQMVFQNPFSSLNPLRTIRSALGDGLNQTNVPRQDRNRKMVDLMNQVGLSEMMLDRYPHEFSGGQRQRVVLARALSVLPEVLVADEPVSALDVSIQAQVLNLLNELKSKLRLTTIFVTHDLRVVNFFCNRIAVMYMGRLVELGPRDVIMEKSKHPYTRMLLSAAPRGMPGESVERLWVKKELDDSAIEVKGCVFASRCWAREMLGNPEKCLTDRPSEQPEPDGRVVACHFQDDIPALADGELSKS